jgi:DNA-binding SARP family transcriptional activator
LGSFDVRPASGSTALAPGKKIQALLAILGVRSDERHSRDRLAGVIWNGVPEEHARHSLRQAIFAIRRLLSDDALSTVGDTIGLNATVVAVDVAEFERASSESTPEAFERAASLYRGDLLDGFRLREPRFEEWLVGERDRLRRQGVLALERLTQARMESANRDGAIESANRLVTLDPTRERAHRTLMHLYTEAGRRAAAIQQYQICESVLAREFGVKPDAETRALYDRIVASDATRVTPNGKPSAVLIVEDEPVTRALLEGFLGTAGYDITAVSDGAEALFQLSGGPFDLILSDIAMPMLDGLALAEVVARKGLRTPIIFITGQPGDELEIKGLESGAVDFIRKPIQKDVLLLRVRKALRAG